MAQDNKIQTALEMIENYDWYWSMADEWMRMSEGHCAVCGH